MALELARAGVGSLHLMDPDILEPHNISRHQCGLHELGRLKVDALRDRIMDICPSIRVQAHPIDVVEDQDNIDLTMDVAEECDLLICTTDTDSSRAFVNDLTLRLGVPSLQVGLHGRAQSGIVQVVSPDNGACFMCHRRSTLDIGAQRNDAVAYSDASDVRDVTIQPGLSSQIGLVAEVGVIRAIDLLCGRGEDSEAEGLPDLTLAYICKSESGSMGRPYLRFVHMDLEKADNCPVCGEPLEE
jgi:molybdopterin/thiamine biosynthesis adenylyltransferase